MAIFDRNITAAHATTLNQIAPFLGITPIPRGEVEAYMLIEQAKAPKPLPFAAYLRLICGCVLAISAVVGVCFAASGTILFAERAENAPVVLLLGIASLVLTVIGMIKLDNVRIIIGDARWQSSVCVMDSNLRFPGVAERAFATSDEIRMRFAKIGIGTVLIKHDLVQDSMILDPVLEVARSNDRTDSIFVAIYDPYATTGRYAQVV